tara:strand:- start:90 stop:569 length:480 start_codon:yes stop_codon:yes gene_type:complete
MKTMVLFVTVLLNALAAGFFTAWSVSVILGTKKVGDFTYLETMQHINKEILNPLFFTLFFGSLITLIITTTLQYYHKPAFWFVLAATLVYLIGTFGVTAFGNVPLNNALEALDLNTMSSLEVQDFRTYYEHAWNKFHRIRTLSGLLSFILLLIAVFIKH